MPHPCTPFCDQLPQRTGSAAALGYHMPAEWELLARVWIDPPHNLDTWPGCLDKAQAQFADFVAALQKHVEVRMLSDLNIPRNDSWIRDYGPIFVVRDRQNSPALSSLQSEIQNPSDAIALHDFCFNAWGGKYEVRDLDDMVPQHVAKHLGCPLFIHDMVLEGGSIDVNGRGTVMTTGQCLLNKNRNPWMKKKAIEQALHDALGTRHVIWLPGGIVGDDTDGHIDDIARFINPTTVIGLRAPEGHPDKVILDRNWRVLKRAKDQDGRKLNVIEMPVPELIYYDFPADRFGHAGRRPVAASYANFLFANQAVLVPIFGQKSDDVALRTLEQALPGHTIIGLRAEFVVVGLGAFHCLTQQEPAVGTG